MNNKQPSQTQRALLTAGTIFLKEPFTPVCIIGIILILTGVYMVNKVD